MKPSLGWTVRAGLVFPLVLMAALAGAVGFAAGRAVYPRDEPARISTIVTTAVTPAPTPAPAPATPEPSQSAGGGGAGGGPADNCPAGCECRHPTGGIVIVCHGGSAVRIP